MSANKSYNVDDILLEIKSRKLREKAEASGEVSKKDDFHLDFSPNEPVVRPEPKTRPEPKPEPRPATRPEPKSEPRPEPRPESRPEPRPDPRPEPRPAPQARRSAPGTERRRMPPDDFEFKMPEDFGAKPYNPMEFSGEARSITEKAKLRGSRSPLQRFEFHAEPDFEPDAFAEPEPDTSAEHTRVLPDMTGMRDNSAYTPKAETLRKKDFGKFTLDAPIDDDYYYDDGEASASNLPEGSVVDYSEYNSTSDRRDVQRDIAHVKLWLFVRVSLTLVLTVILFVITFSAKYQEIPLPEFMLPEVSATVRMYYIVCTALTILVALVNSSAVGGGLMGLFKMHSNSDTLAAFAILAAVGQGVAVVADPSVVEPEALNLYFGVAALTMLFNAIGKMTMINRILSNFKIIASDKPKKSILAVESEEFCREFFKDTIHRPVIAYSVRANFFTDFLGLSYSDKYDVGINRATAPVCFGGSLLVGGITYLLTGSSLSAVSAITAILCVCATLSSTFIENVPLSKLTKKLAPQGGMVSGSKAVENFCETKAVVLTENDLFPRGNVQLHGIKAFSQKRIDEAILDAASVLCAMDGSLGPVFLEMIGGNKKLLKKAENITFENAMGISAWVDQRRVLIGNRRLMLNHGITLPPEALQQKSPQISTEAEPLFLSNSGEATAMFTVSYHIDEELAVELDRLAHHDNLLIVYTTDANITAEKIWEIYGYPIELIRILPAEWHTRYKKISEPRDKAIAEIVYTDKASAMVKALLASISARSSILSATVIQLIQIVIGYAFLTFMAFMGSIGTINVTGICAYQLFWFAAIFIVQQVRQI